ncbi:MAG TPA: alpha/beta hydrolase [Patescibacteria group bacterium]|nr:alpha/beta hydrolase [Patescibacteria group bacterium]
MPRTSNKYKFDNGRGQQLVGIIDRPETTPLFWGVFGPCFTCPKESHAAAKVCRHLAENGVAMLRIDVTGQGESQGEFSETNFTTRVLDLVAACKALARDHAEPKLLIGHSISGTAALAASEALPGLKAIATIGSPRDPAAIIEKFRRQELITEKNSNEIEIMVINQRVTFKKSFIEDMLGQEVAAKTAALDKKLFIFHAPQDNIVTVDNAREIYERASKADRELIILDEMATHLFENRREDAERVADTLLRWFATQS